MDRAQFYKEVYSITKEIPYGNVFTYGKIAQLIGNPQYSRMVGQALSYAPKEEDLPCHRVVNSQGRLAGRNKKNYWKKKESPSSAMDASICPNTYGTLLVHSHRQ